jgi:hypothetical protein
MMFIINYLSVAILSASSQTGVSTMVETGPPSEIVAFAISSNMLFSTHAEIA